MKRFRNAVKVAIHAFVREMRRPKDYEVKMENRRKLMRTWVSIDYKDNGRRFRY